MDKILLINKPSGITSFDAVRKCRHIFHEKKTGHTGTLDPEASGLMIVLTGKYTKLLPFCVKDHKSYHAEFILGIKTETEDIWGSTVEEKTPSFHTEEEIREAEKALTGDISQVPPMYSALKVNGKKLYEYARQGIVIERSPRPAHISFLHVEQLDERRFSMDATVSSGTYIRTLITDFCREINEIGSMSFLERRAVEHIRLDQAVPLDELTEDEPGTAPWNVISPEWTIAEAADEKMIRNGRALYYDSGADKIIFRRDDTLLAAYERREDGMFHCVRGLS